MYKSIVKYSQIYHSRDGYWSKG